MKSITLKIVSTRKGDYVPPRAGDTPLTPEEENVILDSVEMVSPEPPDEDAADTMELTTAATMEIDADGRFSIRYRESELSGMEGTTTTITFLAGDRSVLTILREGTVNSALVLEQGRFHSGVYQTPVMPLDITTMTYRLRNDVTAEGGTITADYSLRIGGVTTSRTKLVAEVLPHV